MAEREYRFPQNQLKDFSTGAVIGTGIGIGLTIAARRIIRENDKHIRELHNTAQAIGESHELPFAQTRIRLSEEELLRKGIEFHSFGDSRVMVNVRTKDDKQDIWVHDGGFPTVVQKLFHTAGFPDVTVVSHATPGEPTGKTVGKIEKVVPSLAKHTKRLKIVSIYNTGNDYNELFSKKRILSLSVTYAPRITKTGEFRREFNKITGLIVENKVKKLRTIAQFHTEHTANGGDGIQGVIYPTPPKFKHTNKHLDVYYYIGKNMRRIRLRSNGFTDRGGATITGGVVEGDKRTLKQIENEIPDSLQLMTVPCHEIDADEDFDGTYHFSALGHKKIALAISKRIDIVSANGSVESLYEKAVRIITQKTTTSAGNL